MTADFLKIKNVSLHFSIHPSFSYRKHEKQPHTRMFPTPNCLGWNAVLFELHGVYYGLQKFLFWAHLTTEYSSSNISQACLKCFSVDIKHSSACLAAMESGVASVHTGHGLNAWPIVLTTRWRTCFSVSIRLLSYFWFWFFFCICVCFLALYQKCILHWF